MTRPTSWTPDRVALLGTMPDAALARLIGLSTGAVLQARRSRKIPVYSAATSGVWVPIDPAQRVRWQAAADAVGLTIPEWLGRMADLSTRGWDESSPPWEADDAR